MFSNWQRKYEEEAERLVQVLRQWYELESETKRLEWELKRCQDPGGAHPPAPDEARKPALLRRAEAGKPIVPESKRGRVQSWKGRYDEVHTFRGHYEGITSRLVIRVERLTKQLADCSASLPQGADKRSAAQPARQDGSTKKDRYERMPPAMRRLRAVLEEVRQEQQATKTPAQAQETEVETVVETPVEPEAPVAQPTPDESEAPGTDEPQAEPEAPVAQEQPAEPEAPQQQEASRSEAAPPPDANARALKQENQALERALREMGKQLQETKAQLQAREKELRAGREAADAVTQKQAAVQKALEALPVLARHFRHGQRGFLDQPDAPDIGSELASLIYYALTHLAIGLATGEKARTRAMYANLHSIARNLQSYKLMTLHGFEAALEILQTLPEGDAAHFAAQLRRSPQTPGAEAHPIRAALKAMRDKASVELRPFYYDIDIEGEVITIG